MNIFKYDPNCYRCNNEGWIVGDSFKDLRTCPVCRGKRFIRVVKQIVYKINLAFFGFFYDTLEELNWVSDDVLDFSRLHNKAIKARVSKNIIVEYASGYAVDAEKLALAFKALKAEQYLLAAQQSHQAAFTNHDISAEFLKNLNEHVKNLLATR